MVPLHIYRGAEVTVEELENRTKKYINDVLEYFWELELITSEEDVTDDLLENYVISTLPIVETETEQVLLEDPRWLREATSEEEIAIDNFTWEARPDQGATTDMIAVHERSAGSPSIIRAVPPQYNIGRACVRWHKSLAQFVDEHYGLNKENGYQTNDMGMKVLSEDIFNQVFDPANTEAQLESILNDVIIAHRLVTARLANDWYYRTEGYLPVKRGSVANACLKSDLSQYHWISRTELWDEERIYNSSEHLRARYDNFEVYLCDRLTFYPEVLIVNDKWLTDRIDIAKTLKQEPESVLVAIDIETDVPYALQLNLVGKSK